MRGDFIGVWSETWRFAGLRIPALANDPYGGG
jgi:hypothetical protein